MERTLQHADVRSPKRWHINTDKVQAAACIAASASVSIGLIAWAIQSLL